MSPGKNSLKYYPLARGLAHDVKLVRYSCIQFTIMYILRRRPPCVIRRRIRSSVLQEGHISDSTRIASRLKRYELRDYEHNVAIAQKSDIALDAARNVRSVCNSSVSFEMLYAIEKQTNKQTICKTDLPRV